MLSTRKELVVQANWYSVTDEHTVTKASLMGTPAKTLDQLSKVVVGFLNGDRIKGYVYEFSALDASFNLLPQDDPLHGREIKVEMRDLKAVFFVGSSMATPNAMIPRPGDFLRTPRTIEVTFTDGEKIVGRPEGYNTPRIGFFIYPANPKGNNIRISWSPEIPAKLDLSNLSSSLFRTTQQRGSMLR